MPDSTTSFVKGNYIGFLLRLGLKGGYRPARNVDEVMEYIYSYLEEKSGECQFSMEELLNQIQGEFYPDIRTVKTRRFKKYGEDIVIAETCNQKCTVCFRNLGYKILIKSWYDNKKSDPQEEKLRVVKPAADIILGDIRSQIYNTSEYTPPDNFLVNVESVIPDSLLVFFQTIVLKNKRSSVDKWRQKCISLEHALISAVRPSSFISYQLNAVTVCVYKEFGSKQLVELLSALGFASSYSETSILELSTIVRPEQIVVNEGAFLQLCVSLTS
ncbi:hypothetical protein AVEN_19720-1 [Araneus ventricosus]|uniref:Uncharacterized protein n=1 Tax=Araneus ventricosus TaxID=182803 RepID=A0A4Y2C4I2_ARAVE|nr:hypothetical protein AVEN_19720-1 [Araneus ventricosus]